MADQSENGSQESSDLPSPQPSEAGAEGTQVQSTSPGAALIVPPQPMDQWHLGAVLHDYADTRSPFLAAVAVAAFEDSRLTREALVNRLRDTERDKERLREQYHEEREKRIASENQSVGRGPLDQFKQYCFGVGGLISGTGITVFFAEPKLRLVGVVITVIGLPLLLLGAPFFHRKRR